MTEELPPYNFIKDNLVHGISADILLQLLEKNDISIDRGSIHLFPWPRAYQMVQDIPVSVPLVLPSVKSSSSGSAL